MQLIYHANDFFFIIQTFIVANSKFRVNYKWKYVTKDGEQYLDIKDAQPVLSHENIVIKLENLFNGDKELGL